MLIPFIVPTVLSAIAFWWIYDSQFSILSWSLMKLGLIDGPINFLGDPQNARVSVIAANVWRGIPFVAICLLAGLQTISPSLYEAAALDGATPWQRFRHVTMPMLMQQGCKVDLPLSCMPLLEDIGKVQSYSYKLKQILFTETLMATPPTC